MAELLPWPRSQFFDDNGNPLAGGKLYSYKAGSSIPLATYADKAASVPNANPVVLNSRGEAPIFLSAQTYKLVLKDTNDVQIWSIDNFVVSQTDTATLAAAIADAQAAQAAAESAATGTAASASAAAASASSAAASASDAATSASNASTSASTATTQAGVATTKAGDAATSATSASGSASTATTQAGIATTKASDAAASATAAATSATNAANSATAAATSASAATGLASYASDAAYVTANGTAQAGDTYFNTTTGKGRIYSGTAWTDIGSGSGSSGINYITNYDAETDTSGWATYNDNTGNVTNDVKPVDGTGGVVTGVTFTRSTTSPLRGTASFVLSKDNFNRQGQGASYAFTIDAADKAKVLEITFDYQIYSGTYADGDVVVYIYDVTNSTLIQPVGYSLSNVTGPSKFKATFQTASNSTSYRLIFHWATVTTGTGTNVQIDNLRCGPQNTVNTALITDWTAYTPTISHDSGGATNLSKSFKYRRVGDTLEVQGQVTFSALSAAFTAFYITLPSGLTVDTSKSANGVADVVGIANVFDGSGSVYGGIIRRSGNFLRLVNGGITTHTGTVGLREDNVSSSFPITATTNVEYNLRATVPVTGWGSNTISAADAGDGRATAFYATGATATVTGSYSDIAWTTTVKDTHGTWSGTTYTVLSPGWLKFMGQLVVGATYAAGQVTKVAMVVSGSALREFAEYSGGADGNLSVAINSGAMYFNAGDTIKFQVLCSGTTPSIPVSSTLNFISAEKAGGSSTIVAGDNVSMQYATSSATTFAHNTINLYVPFPIKNWDTHGMWNGTDTATAPVSGEYEVDARVILQPTDAVAANVSWATGEQASISVAVAGVAAGMIDRFETVSQSGIYVMLKGSIKVKALAGQSIKVYLFQTSGQTVRLYTDALANILTIRRVGNY